MTQHRPNSVYIFDTGPLSAFARIRRLDLLEQRYCGRARVTVEVVNEIARGADKYAGLRAVLSATWLGDPLRLVLPDMLAEIELLREALGGSQSALMSHRGEAATIIAATELSGVAVIDDWDARVVAASRGVPIIGTEGILRACARDTQLDWETAWELFGEMKLIGHRLRDISFEEFRS